MSLSEKRENEEVEEEEDDVQTHIAASPEPSFVSMKSDKSIGKRPDLSDVAVTSDPEVKRTNMIGSVTPCLSTSDSDSLPEEVLTFKDRHKTSMKNKHERLLEGIKLENNQTLLNRIYTELYIIEGESEGVNEEHEVLQMEKRPRTQDNPIYCNDIFKPLHQPGCEEKDKIKTVLTKGIAGIGKTVSVQKFILDWTEGKANQDVDFMFVLPFRELNLIKDRQYSLHRLLLDFHPELQDLDSKIYEEYKVVFIFDGLDENRNTLMFSDEEKVSDVNESSSVGVLMSNLIRGELLPSALIWITSRPAAANQIPSKYINRVTEIQGFNEPQKEEYFRKRISDEHQASRIISHIKRSRSLNIMCHIPVFCWISATVLQKLLEQDDSAEIPQTLTEMYIHFLLTQINLKNQKYDGNYPEKLLKFNREVILKLAELAFKQLMKGNVMFNEEDLIESGIDVTDASVYSGLCTEIFKEESVIHQRKVYCFIHLSFQEFLAALYIFYFSAVKNEESVTSFLYEGFQGNICGSFLYELTVDKSLQSQSGHLDLFLRFLLGFSLESNQRLLQDLLTCTVYSSEIIKRITQYIKYKLTADESLSADKCINLFLCLLEMNDQTLYIEIQEFVKSENHSVNPLSTSHCSTIAYILQISEEVLDKFDLKKFNTSDEGKKRLMPAVVNCKKALLACCNLTAQCCKSLSSYLQSSNSLRELDLSNNDLQDLGVKLLSDGLMSSHCQLNILRLADCNLTAQCCESLSSYLQSSNSSLRELDLSHNNLQDLGVKLLSDGLKSSHCQLNILRLSGCMVTEEGCCFLALSLNPSHLRELDLSYNHPGQSLAKLCTDPYYRLDKLNVDHGGEIRITTGLQKYACDLTLDLDTANTFLTLSENNRKCTASNMSVDERECGHVQTHKAASPEPSCVSIKSDKSMPIYHNLSEGPVTSDPDTTFNMENAASPEPSCVSIKSDKSMPIYHDLSDGPVTSDSELKRDDVITSVTPRLTCTSSDSKTLIRQRVKDQHKNSMKNKYERLFEGIKLEENQTLLNRIYTQLYIIEGESEGVNEEHEVLQIKKPTTQDTPIYCNDIFKPLHQPGHEEKDKIKTVLTKGIAGIGKTVSVQKFILDWTEGKANQDVDFMFVLPFRELNLIKDHQYSLHRLLLEFHPELQDLDSKIYKECKVVFIFDGLDESRITLMFTDNEKVSDVNESSSVGVLMSNLIRGELVPSALIWITSRPAAANQIPSKYINRVTEIQGFNDHQKDEYFSKNISDKHQAEKIISHIKTARSLHIMCHIPVFCWITATVLQKQDLLKQDDGAEIPQTLTEMYIHFLLTQINMRNQKYDERDPEKLLKSNRDVILKLAELAFNQLMKGNVTFYEEDLIESSIDVTDASVYSGICTEIFMEESVIHQRKVYCFIHLSFQEFLAALYMFYCYVVKNEESMKFFLTKEYQWYSGITGTGKTLVSLCDLLKAAVYKSLQSKNGHLDLFLRFLLGISLESNQRLLQDLLTHTVNSSETIKEIRQYIKDKLKADEHLSADRCISLFLCLLEMKDQTLYREIQEFVKSENKLSLAHCLTIAYMFQITDDLDESDLKKFNTSDEGRKRVIPAVVKCEKAYSSGCVGDCCFLASDPSHLSETNSNVDHGE
ncbi:hypothetical protein QQF64_010673 [Cirrhinus molitorella]|uniref:NACHT domain-containing protein n=1 Tax=Cirrhinus molitorella TaxID=172907 RepID=A0ABR3M0G0_9TELE